MQRSVTRRAHEARCAGTLPALSCAAKPRFSYRRISAGFLCADSARSNYSVGGPVRGAVVR